MTSLFSRAGAVTAVLCAAAVAAAPASARLYVSTSTTSDAADGYVEGYGYTFGAPGDDTYKLEIVRGGALVASSTSQYYASVPFRVAAGDHVTVTDVTTSAVQSYTVTGQPTLDAGMCGTTAAFSGTRDPGATINASADVWYGSYDARNDDIYANPIAGPGTTFAGTFPKAVAANWTVTISQTRAINNDFTVFSDVTRAVGDCAVKPTAPAPKPTVTLVPTVAPTPAKDVVPPKGVLLPQPKVFQPAAAYTALVGGTFANTVTVTEPGTVTQTLYLDDGAALPKATAAAKKKKAKKPTVLGSGRVAVAKAGAVKVNVRLSKSGKSKLKRSRTVKLALVTVIKDNAGNARVLAPKRFTVKRAKAGK